MQFLYELIFNFVCEAYSITISELIIYTDYGICNASSLIVFLKFIFFIKIDFIFLRTAKSILLSRIQIYRSVHFANVMNGLDLARHILHCIVCKSLITNSSLRSKWFEFYLKDGILLIWENRKYLLSDHLFLI